jgi:hypothetical protein
VLAVGSASQSNLGTAWNWICFGILQVDLRRWEAVGSAENKS